MVKNVLNTLRKKQKNNKGFSLVELIVVIAIMAVLVGVLAPQLIRYVEKSRESTDIQNCDNIVTALKSFYADKENASTPVVVTLKTNADPSVVPGTGTALGKDDDKNPLKDAKLAGTKLRSNKWKTIDGSTATDGSTDGIEITYKPDTGEVTYKAYADHYKVNAADPSQIVPINK